MPLAAVEPGPAALERALHDPGTDREHAGSAPRGRHGSGGKTADGRIDSVQPRPHQSTRPAEAGRAGLRVLRGGQTGIRSLASRKGRSLMIGSELRAVAYIRSAPVHASLALSARPPVGATKPESTHAGCEPSTCGKQHACRFAAQAVQTPALRSGIGRVDFR